MNDRTVDLAPAETLEALSILPKRSPYVRRPSLPRRPGPSKARSCSCGACRFCKDNAEWDRRFEAKFGSDMREYYAKRPLGRLGSSLGD